MHNLSFLNHRHVYFFPRTTTPHNMEHAELSHLQRPSILHAFFATPTHTSARYAATIPGTGEGVVAGDFFIPGVYMATVSFVPNDPPAATTSFPNESW
mmetsp:Transcript_1489/g.3812  ORF Transcript_1489/g.3812 Transcript_1489/m.3812 type:complete len:98 (+) Transcript_1489:299-592(+)